MSDYFPHRDPARPGHRPGYPDYADTGSAGTWVWVAVVLVALFALLVVAFSGGGSTPADTTADGAAIEAAPATTPEATAPAVPAD